MSWGLARRLATALGVIALVASATFAVLHLAPGEPSVLVDDPRLSSEQREALRELWGLDQPLGTQYLRWLTNAATGDWGISYQYRRPALDLVLEAMPTTAALGLGALLVQLTLGTGLGATSARRPGRPIDRTAQVIGLTLYSVPTFWLALVAILVFSYRLDWFPPSHLFDPATGDATGLARWADIGHHLALPALVLGVAAAGGVARFVRTTLIDAHREPHRTAARARGLSPGRVLWHHTLRPKIGPLVQVVALSLPALLSGALVTEVVFSLPGLGRVAFQAMTGRDYPVVLACTTWSAVLVVAATLAADVVHAALDPRVRRNA